jgi:hypothetical protein
MRERTVLVLIGCVLLILLCLLALAVTVFFVASDWLERLQNELFGPPVRSVDASFGNPPPQGGRDSNAGAPVYATPSFMRSNSARSFFS